MINIDIVFEKLHYTFSLFYKISVLTGESGIGKTSLYNVIDRYTAKLGGVTYKGDVAIKTIPKKLELKYALDMVHESTSTLFVLDEDCAFLHEKGFEQLFNEGKDNYFLMITRERKFCSLPIHRDAFYKLHCSGKYYIFKPLYEFRKTQNKVDVLVSEDSESGFMFLKDFVSDVVSAHGKSNFNTLAYATNKTYGLVYDSCGISFDCQKLVILFNRYPNLFDFSWDSFERYILKCLFPDKEINSDSSVYLEKYYEHLLHECLLKYDKHYAKSQLLPCLRKDACSSCKGKCFLRHTNNDMLRDNLSCYKEIGLVKPDGYTQEVWDMMTVEEKEEVLRMIDNMQRRG